MRGDAKRVAIASLYPMSDVPRPSAQIFLKKKEDFERVKREGTRVTTRFFNVVSCASCPGNTRIGVVVGRRFGNAVLRNRGKRIFRALVRNTSNLLLKGNDIIVFPKRSVLDLPHPNLYQAWVAALCNQGLMVSPESLSCAN